jgi:hypothetical protein
MGRKPRRKAGGKKSPPPLIADIRSIRRRLPRGRNFIDDADHAALVARLQEPDQRKILKQRVARIFRKVATKPDGRPKHWAIRLTELEPRAVQIGLEFALLTITVKGFRPATSKEKIYHRRLDRIRLAVKDARRKANFMGVPASDGCEGAECRSASDACARRPAWRLP